MAFTHLKPLDSSPWIDKHTSFLLQDDIITAFEQILYLLDAQTIPYKISKKYFKVKARITSFIDYCDFRIQIYKGNILELQHEMGSKDLFYILFRTIQIEFTSSSSSSRNIDPSLQVAELTQDEKVLLWQQTVSQADASKDVWDMFYQSFQALTLIAFQLPLQSIHYLIDLNRLASVLLVALQSKDLELVRLGCIMLQTVIHYLPTSLWKEHIWLLWNVYQV
jgi:hypothetical protein